MTGHRPIDRESAEAVFLRYAPLFEKFDEEGIDYCLVGGLAVLAHCLANESGRLRATEDADVMVPPDYSNADFARDYLSVYAADPDTSKAVYDALLGESGFDELSEEEAAFMNVSFVGADEDLDGVDTPDFDVCRMLNARSLATISRERLSVCGVQIWVATVDELLGMKRDTVSLYGVGIESSSRPHDFIDIASLEALSPQQEEGGLRSKLSDLLGGRR